MSTTYKLKSSAQRAAKKLPEGTFDITQNDAGEWIIAPKGAALQAFLKETAASVADIKAKAVKIKKDYAPKIAATMPKASVTSPEAPIPAPAPAKIEEIAPPASIHAASNALIANFLASEQANADKQANADLVNVDAMRPRISTIDKPTKKVWSIADDMVAAAKAAGLPVPSRKEVQAQCVRQGIAYGTARTQYQAWFKCINDSKAAPIAVIGKDGKAYIPTK